MGKRTLREESALELLSFLSETAFLERITMQHWERLDLKGKFPTLKSVKHVANSPEMPPALIVDTNDRTYVFMSGYTRFSQLEALMSGYYFIADRQGPGESFPPSLWGAAVLLLRQMEAAGVVVRSDRRSGRIGFSPTKPVEFFGHSLGGAIVQAAAAALVEGAEASVALTTFGAPASVYVPPSGNYPPWVYRLDSKHYGAWGDIIPSLPGSASGLADLPGKGPWSAASRALRWQLVGQYILLEHSGRQKPHARFEPPEGMVERYLTAHRQGKQAENDKYHAIMHYARWFRVNEPFEFQPVNMFLSDLHESRLMIEGRKLAAIKARQDHAAAREANRTQRTLPVISVARTTTPQVQRNVLQAAFITYLTWLQAGRDKMAFIPYQFRPKATGNSKVGWVRWMGLDVIKCPSKSAAKTRAKYLFKFLRYLQSSTAIDQTNFFESATAYLGVATTAGNGFRPTLGPTP